MNPTVERVLRTWFVDPGSGWETATGPFDGWVVGRRYASLLLAITSNGESAWFDPHETVPWDALRNARTGGCGTYAGMQRHKRHKETVCPACRHAGNVYMRHWRATHSDIHGRRYNKARQKALTKLAHRHSREFKRLLAREMSDE